MVVGMFWVLLLLIAAIDIDQLLLSSEEKRIVLEKGRREEILQRLKEQEASLRLLHLRVKKEIEDLEARQEALTTPALAADRKIQQYMYKALFLAAFMLLKLWR